MQHAELSIKVMKYKCEYDSDYGNKYEFMNEHTLESR